MHGLGWFKHLYLCVLFPFVLFSFESLLLYTLGLGVWWLFSLLDFCIPFSAAKQSKIFKNHSLSWQTQHCESIQDDLPSLCPLYLLPIKKGSYLVSKGNWCKTPMATYTTHCGDPLWQGSSQKYILYYLYLLAGWQSVREPIGYCLLVWQIVFQTCVWTISGTPLNCYGYLNVLRHQPHTCESEANTGQTLALTTWIWVAVIAKYINLLSTVAEL